MSPKLSTSRDDPTSDLSRNVRQQFHGQQTQRNTSIPLKKGRFSLPLCSHSSPFPCFTHAIFDQGGWFNQFTAEAAEPAQSKQQDDDQEGQRRVKEGGTLSSQ